MLSLTLPTESQLLQALLDVVAADANGGDSLLNAIAAPFGTRLDAVTRSPTDPGELQFLKVGSRASIAQGLSVHVFPGGEEERWFSTPSGKQTDYKARVQAYWIDPPDVGPFLTETPRLLWKLFPDLTEALKVVLGPENLGAGFGGWEVPGGGVVLNPFIKTSYSCAWIEYPTENRSEMVYYNSLVWTAQKYTS